MVRIIGPIEFLFLIQEWGKSNTERHHYIIQKVNLKDYQLNNIWVTENPQSKINVSVHSKQSKIIIINFEWRLTHIILIMHAYSPDKKIY